MNAQPQPAEFALALYATARETHQRKDWRQACHALADALKAEMMRTTAVQAPPAPPVQDAAPAAPKRATRAPKATAYDMTAEGLTAALRLLCRVIQPRNSIPILDHVLLIASGDALAALKSDRVTVWQEDANCPARLEAADPGDLLRLAVVMPLRV